MQFLLQNKQKVKFEAFKIWRFGKICLSLQNVKLYYNHKKYEWFVKNEDGNYYSSGITTAELDLHTFIDNMIGMVHEEAVGDYTFICKVTDGNGTVESNEATLTIVAKP